MRCIECNMLPPWKEHNCLCLRCMAEVHMDVQASIWKMEDRLAVLGELLARLGERQ